VKNTSAELLLQPQAATGQLYSFVEDSCHTPDGQLRTNLQQVAFRLFSVGRGLGCRVDTSFTASYGLYYQMEDDQLISLLQYACPHVNWFHNKVYHRWLDLSRIQVLDSDTGGLLAQIETRRYMGRVVRPQAVQRGDYGPNVVSMAALRAARAVAADVRSMLGRAGAAAARQDPGGESGDR